MDDSITIASVKRAIKDVIRVGAYIPTPEVIIEETARYFSITAADIRGQRRSKNLAKARQVSMYLMRNLTNLSLVDIGSQYEGRNHSTVLTSIRKVEDLIKTDPEISATVRDISSNINRAPEFTQPPRLKTVNSLFKTVCKFSALFCLLSSVQNPHSPG